MISPEERRSHGRLTDDPAALKFVYDVRTRMTYYFKNSPQIPQNKIFTGSIKNVSAEGLCFISNQQLHRGDRLEILVSLPGAHEAVRMEAEARWSTLSDSNQLISSKFNTGVRVLSVEGQSVPASVHFDDIYHVHWSVVLESILGRFRILQQEKKSSDNGA